MVKMLNNKENTNKMNINWNICTYAKTLTNSCKAIVFQK